jgi:hypothetical protein
MRNQSTFDRCTGNTSDGIRVHTSAYERHLDDGFFLPKRVLSDVTQDKFPFCTRHSIEILQTSQTVQRSSLTGLTSGY